DTLTVCRFIQNAEPTRQIFEDLVATANRCLDSYYWLDNAETGDIKSVLEEIRGTAELIIDEFEKVVAFKKQARDAIAALEEEFTEKTRDLRENAYDRIEPFLEGLTALRGLRGKAITLKDMRYMDLERLGAVEDKTAARFDEVSQACVRFLLNEDAFGPLKTDIESTLASLSEVAKVKDVEPLQVKVDKTSEGLDLLSQVVADLKIDDATQRTEILENISEVFAQLNRARATIEGRRKELLSFEGKAEFAAQFALLGQSVSSALALCDTPEKCDEQLSRVMVQLQELEGRFSEFDEFIGDLAQKREEVYDAFSAKKQQLNDERQRRVGNIASAIDRILDGVDRRSRQMEDQDSLNAYFASDAMVLKVRDLADELRSLGDSVKADSYESKLASARQNALRGLRDKLELFEGGDDVIKFGRHRFSVNTQPLELAMVARDGKMQIHLNGTDFYADVQDERFAATQRFWSQSLVSENETVYRAEYLAAEILDDAERGKNELTIHALHERLREGTLGDITKRYAQQRYDEGYDRGLHDADAALILERLINMREAAGLLRYPPSPRAAACLFWTWFDDEARKTQWHLQAKNLGRLRAAFGHGGALRRLAMELEQAMVGFVAEHGIDVFRPADLEAAGEYLVEELVADRPAFITSGDANSLRDELLRHVDLHGDRRAFDDDFRALESVLRERFELARAWVEAYVDHPDRKARAHLSLEAAVLLCETPTGPRRLDREASSAVVEAEVEGLLGQHKRVENQRIHLRIDEFMERLGHFRQVEAPAYRAYRTLRHEILEHERTSLRLDELMPKVMSAFVRNKLINEVYLPLIGDNLAKQIGAVGESKRTDLMGLLLLISPPGYGKTTLMEYVANRLGLVFVKVNGPSLGHSVVSLDPSEAPNATARQEVEKINLAFEMGNNVMLYLDDIQHTHPELLQKFISLCDAQRRIEGVWRGRTRTYDMRGRKFCVVMAGNPYTETGDKFTIPDMLANRADTYNLGDILEGKREAFELSYIENSLTSNTVLQPLATREQSDVYKLIRRAKGEEIPATDLSHGYSAMELNEIETVLRHLFRVQHVLLLVNMQYISSASQDDTFRTEPSFKLQGSYRNMNRLAEKVMSAMNEQEVEALISDHYVGESQTLTTGAENNLLKLAEMRGILTDDERERWDDIKGEFVRHKRMGGAADDPVARLTGTLTGLSSDLGAIKDALDEGRMDRSLETTLDKVAGHLEQIQGAIVDGAPTTSTGFEKVAGHLAQIQGAIVDGAAPTLGAKLNEIAAALSTAAQAGPDEAVVALGHQLRAIEQAVIQVSQVAHRAAEVEDSRDAQQSALMEAQRVLQAQATEAQQSLAAAAQAQAGHLAHLAQSQGSQIELLRSQAEAAQRSAEAQADQVKAQTLQAQAQQQSAQAQQQAAAAQQQSVAAHQQSAQAQLRVATARQQSAAPAAGPSPNGNPRVHRAELLAGEAEWMKPYLLRIEAALEALGRPQIEVQTSTPSEVQALLAHQTQLIENTIVPLVRTAASRLHDSEQVMATLQQVQYMLHQLRYR
ncbi:MAG: AAA family ATPase, partial [Myxococcota bacterium]